MADDTDDPNLTSDEQELIDEVMACFAKARDATSAWRQNARENYDYVAGRQWSDADLAAMQEANRPALVFNRLAAIKKAISGQEANARHETKYQPRTLDDTGLTECINQTAKWSLEECDAGAEEAESFGDMIVCGIGVTDDRMDYETEDTGSFVRDRCDPLEYYIDPAAKKKNLADRRWDLRVTSVDTDKLRMQFPDMPDQPDKMWALDTEDETSPHDQDAANEYATANPNQRKYGQTKVGLYQWYILEDGYLVDFPAPGGQGGYKTERVDAKTFKKIEKRLESLGYKSTQVKTRRYYRALLANGVVLERKKSPCDGFTTKFMTGERDRNKGTFRGVIDDLKDPQKWANKFFSAMIDITASTAKGGIMAEVGSFKDERQAEASWANPRRITWLNQGALSGNRIEAKPVANYPTSLDKLLMFANDSIHQVSGINVEFMGAADRDQPGIVEVQRKQSAITILAPYFDSLKSYRKLAGKVHLDFIRKYYPAETIARVVGPELARYVPMIKDEKAIKFDVIVDESPTSQNQKDSNWAVLAQLLPEAVKLGIPVPPDVLDYLPISVVLAEKWKAYMAKQAQDPIRQQKQQLELQGMQADNAKGFSQAQANQARAQAAQKQDPKLDAMLKIQQMQADLQKMAAELQMEREKASMEMQIKVADHQIDAQAQADQHRMDMVHASQQHQVDLQQGAQEHQQALAINAQMGDAKVEQMKAQAAAKPANGSA